MAILKPVMRLVSPAGPRGKLLVFIFHRVLAQSDPLLPAEPTGAQFDWMMRLCARNFNVLPFGRAVALLNRGELPAASACITFDDGYRDNFSVALPILRRYGLPATFFISTGFLDQGRMWNDDIIEAVRSWPGGRADWSDLGLDRHDLLTAPQRLGAIAAVLGRLRYFPHAQRQATAREIARRAGVDDRSDLMMTADEVRAIRFAGMEVGAHTHTHPILSSLDDGDACAEIVRGKRELETILSAPVDVFAYPNGNPLRDLAAAHVEMVRKAGFVAAATTQSGVGRANTDPLLMPRFTPWDRTPGRFATRCALALAGRC